MADGYVHLTLQQLGLVMLVIALLTVALEEQLARLDAVFAGFIAVDLAEHQRSRKFVLATGIVLGLASIALLILSGTGA